MASPVVFPFAYDSDCMCTRVMEAAGYILITQCLTKPSLRMKKNHAHTVSPVYTVYAVYWERWTREERGRGGRGEDRRQASDQMNRMGSDHVHRFL